MDYSALRESGMEWIRLWAKTSWTDHNTHDPGITMLEACSYAMTELGLRLDLDVVDLLRSGEAHALPQLEPAHHVLPVGPVNAGDLRRVLLDHPLVSDVQILQPAASEVAFYQAPGINPDPPLTYTAGTPRVRPDGLSEVLVELADRALNSNTYAGQVTVGQVFDIEIALPFWDDPEAAPFRQPATINSVAMILDAGAAWKPLPEAQSYYGRLTVSYTDALGVPGSVESWALLRITTPLTQPALVLPGILAAAQAAIETTATSPLQLFAQRVRSAAIAVEELRVYLASWRNLDEQPVRIGLARIQDVAVRAQLEVSGGIDVEKLLARIFMDIDAALTPRVRFRSLAERMADEPDSAAIYDGPLLRRGFLGGGGDDISYPRVVYTSDILRIIMRNRSDAGGDLVTQENPAGRDIVAVTNLTLGNFINNRPITTGAADCLHMVEIERYLPRLSIAKSRIVCVRNESEVAYDLSRVQALYDELQDEVQAEAITTDPSPVLPVVRGDVLPVETYVPLQDELPATYGVGRAVLPDSAGPQRLAAVKQLQGYLLPFEQMLGDVTAQLGNINRFFSADGALIPSYFVRAPFDLPGVQPLLRSVPAGADWQTFIADPDNAVMQALREAAESRESQVDRRNRMLDHLLARQGEDLAALGQEIHRWARVELQAASLPPSQQEASITDRREAANERLLRHKSALLRDAPELNAMRLLANSSPFVSDDTLLVVEPVGAGFAWRLSIGGAGLRAITLASSSAAAAIAAERALALAGRAANYTNVDIGGGQRRLDLMDGTGAGAQAIGESVQAFGSVADANAALAPLANAFDVLRIESSMSPFERKVAHYSGFRDLRRRRALALTSTFFQIVDDPPGGGLFGRRWVLHQLPGNAGDVLLVSAVRYEAATDPQATALAEQAILQVLRYGLDEWNYAVVPAPLNTFQVELRDPAGTLLAIHGTPLATAEDARTAIDAAVAHLYQNYGAERMLLVEHLLLRPRRNGDPFLSLPDGETACEQDPYSQRLTLVLPSGWARDFSIPLPGATLSEIAPHRFRDAEFRSHFEGMVRRACPAHLLPTIYWVDREAPGTPAADASYDSFEGSYFAWLETVLVPGELPAAIDGARNDLVNSLNAVANDAA